MDVREYPLKTVICSINDEVGMEKVDGAAVIWAMFKAAISYSTRKDAASLYFLVRPALARIVQRGGFSIHRVGGPCQYRGVRFAYRANLQEPANMLCSGDKASVGGAMPVMQASS
ncbi:hypothetical protein [Ectothiorhodospira lacustris]|uniref:hypothetical protein n=1 Tax=Ectothiorhodospira lacustris TaxID=2899127 RepID=UPI001EE97FB2|nr:hypothetical protein [Ectothiorhodospira lacustris]MCG5510848.1 hypothetical protein [Ectothiorhodospira lacustris]MCG5522606.1 hypothetical protein [Ectothiorhodospira lacustris]